MPKGRLLNKNISTYRYITLLLLMASNSAMYAYGFGIERLGGFSGGHFGNFPRSFYYARYLRGGGDWTWFMIGGYAILGFFLVLIVRYCLRMYFFYKRSAETTNKLEQICEVDSSWNKEEMESHASDLFFKIQKAWEKRDIEKVKSDLTPEFAELFQNMLNEMKAKEEINMLNHIQLEEVKIIGFEDYSDNNKDQFTAYMFGTIQDYTINEKTEEIIRNVNQVIEEFEDTYHFIRRNDKWLLEDIRNQVKLRDILLAPNYTENIN